ncbi:MAG: hypothetical protein GDA41_11815 [Rhodospirillales bacterium]|nr:hypothetical protein [Rhodospirillales bacterium]
MLTPALSVALLIVSPLVSAEGVGRSNLTLQGKVADSANAQPFVKEETSGVRKTFPKGADFTHEIVFSEGRLRERAEIGLEGKDVGNFAPLEYDFPFTMGGETLVVKLTPVQRDDAMNAGNVESLYHQRIDDLKYRELPVFYQQARAAALGRIERLRKDSMSTHDYDIIAVYVYLAVMHEMMRAQTFFLPPADEVDIARKFMEDEIRLRPGKVNKIKPGVKGIEKILGELKYASSKSYEAIWKNKIEKPKTCEESRPFLIDFKNDFFKNPLDDQQEISAGLRLTGASILSSYIECEVEQIRCSKAEEISINDVQNKIDKMINEVESHLARKQSKKDNNNLKKDRVNLDNLKRDLSGGGQRNCPR